MRFAWIESLMFSLLIAACRRRRSPRTRARMPTPRRTRTRTRRRRTKSRFRRRRRRSRTAVSTSAARAVHYTATAGNVLIREDKEDKPEASVFYVAYTVDDDRKGSRSARSRSSTTAVRAHRACGCTWARSRRCASNRRAPTATAPPPYRLIPNPYSLIDKSDLVFIDAVGTGYSTPVGKAKGKDFWGVDQDLHAFAKAITRYVTINQRWNSPKFLFGESYGTTRSAGLVNMLQSQGMAFNGVVLLSSILNYASNSPGLDQNYIGSLPTFAAIAWYHDKVPNKPASMDAFVNEARAFATGEYASALAQRPGADAGRGRRDRREARPLHGPFAAIPQGSEPARQPGALSARSCCATSAARSAATTRATKASISTRPAKIPNTTRPTPRSPARSPRHSTTTSKAR